MIWELCVYNLKSGCVESFMFLCSGPVIRKDLIIAGLPQTDSRRIDLHLTANAAINILPTCVFRFGINIEVDDSV